MRPTIPDLVREMGIFEEIPILNPSVNRKSQRYRTDATYRARVIATAKRWNKQNRERKRENDARWARSNGAAASRRYRKRLKDHAA